MSFAHLNLCAPILKAINQCGYTHPTPIQAQAIPHILANRDLIAISQTGTGKTAAFVLPALQNLLQRDSKQKLPSVLILAPVRELANQISDTIYKYSSKTNIRVVSIFGGTSYRIHSRQLAKPVDIIVATPGRLLDYLERGTINLSQVNMLVLDEADRMLDMGFIDDVKKISKYLPQKRQTVLTTATMDARITKLSQTMLKNPEYIKVSSKSVTLEKIKQMVYLTNNIHHKNQLLTHLLTTENIYKSIIFSATKRHTEQLVQQLRDQGHMANALHGDIKQSKRIRILDQFKKGRPHLLVATDVAARGIDIDDISHVINFDIPRTAEDYVHRIGRTGRAGRNGIAISLILTDEKSQLKRIENFIGNSIEQNIVQGLEPKINSTQEKPGKKFHYNKNKKKTFHHNKNKSSKSSKNGIKRRDSRPRRNDK